MAADRDIWTSGDICAHYGIQRSLLAYWRTRPGFPEPLRWTRNQGGTWDGAEVRAWVQAFRAGEPETLAQRVQAVRQKKGGATISAIARNLDRDRATIRRWLRHAGAL